MSKRRLITKKRVQAAIDDIHAIFREHGITEDEADVIWQGMAAFCAYQLCNGTGPFADFIKKHPECREALFSISFTQEANPFSKN